MLWSTPFFCRIVPDPRRAYLLQCFYLLKNILFLVAAPLQLQIIRISSLVRAVRSFPGGVFKCQRNVTVFPGLHLGQTFARLPCKTVQSQLRLLLRFTSEQPVQILLEHDVIKSSLTPNRSRYKHPLQP